MMSSRSVIVLLFILFFKKIVISEVSCPVEEYCQFEKYPSFCSSLPIAILYTDGPALFSTDNGSPSYLSEYRYLSYLNVFGNGAKGVKSCMVASDLTYSGYVGIRLRGRSTMYISKSQFSVKTYGNVAPNKVAAAKADWIYTTNNGGDSPRSGTCTNLNSGIFPNIDCTQRKTKAQCKTANSRPFPCQWIPNTISGNPQDMPKKKDTRLMGMRSGNNWIFHAPGIYDHSLMRSFLAYNMARDSGEYATRTQFFELFIVAEYGRSSHSQSRVPSLEMHSASVARQNDYRGIYLLAESPHAVGKGRLPIKKMSSGEGFNVDRGADGGYILSYDSADDYVMPINAYRGAKMNVEYPDSDKITSSQFNYIQGAISKWDSYFRQNIYAVDSSINDVSNPSKLAWLRYRDFIDLKSWALYILHMDISKNQDGYSNSFYMYKRENSNIDSCSTINTDNCVDYPASEYFGPPLSKGTFGKWGCGPAWDYNLAYANPIASTNVRDLTGWKFLGSNYWRKFASDPLFVDLLITQWTLMRQSKWSTENIHNFIDETGTNLLGNIGINSPMERESIVQGSQSVSRFQEETQILKSWFRDRMSWIDEHICELYQTSYNPSTSGKDSMVPTHQTQKDSACTSCTMGKCVCGMCVDTSKTPTPVPTPLSIVTSPSYASHPVYGQLKINELMAKNDRTIKDSSGAYADWVEIYNPGPKPEQIGNYFLMMTNTWLVKTYTLPRMILNPGERKLIWCDGNNLKGSDHAPFTLSGSKGGKLSLFALSKKSDEIQFGPLGADEAWGRYPDGTNNLFLLQPTPGSANLKLAVTSSPTTIPTSSPTTIPTLSPTPNPNQIKINELGKGNTDDWVELYNNGKRFVQLNLYYLSNNPSSPMLFQLPSKMLPPGKFILIWLDQYGLLGSNHAPFRLNSGGGTIILSFFDKKKVDSVSFPPLGTGWTYGRFPDGNDLFTENLLPTPKKGNQMNADTYFRSGVCSDITLTVLPPIKIRDSLSLSDCKLMCQNNRRCYSFSYAVGNVHGRCVLHPRKPKDASTSWAWTWECHVLSKVCIWSSKYLKTSLGKCTSNNCKTYSTLNYAMKGCEDLGARCNGVTKKTADKGGYTTRFGTNRLISLDEVSWEKFCSVLPGRPDAVHAQKKNSWTKNDLSVFFNLVFFPYATNLYFS